MAQKYSAGIIAYLCFYSQSYKIKHITQNSIQHFLFWKDQTGLEEENNIFTLWPRNQIILAGSIYLVSYLGAILNTFCLLSQYFLPAAMSVDTIYYDFHLTDEETEDLNS